MTDSRNEKRISLSSRLTSVRQLFQMRPKGNHVKYPAFSVQCDMMSHENLSVMWWFGDPIITAKVLFFLSVHDFGKTLLRRKSAYLSSLGGA